MNADLPHDLSNLPTPPPADYAAKKGLAVTDVETGFIRRWIATITHRMSQRGLAFTVAATVATAGTGTGLAQLAGKATPSAVVIHDFLFTPATLTVAPG